MSEGAWPPQCCVPAFLLRAVQALSAAAGAADSDEVRRRVAELLGVVLSPEDDNPWSLPTSDDPADWGVTPRRATAAFASLPALLGADLTLEIVKTNEIPFGLYEDAVLELSRGTIVIGVGFDYAFLQERLGRPRPRRRAHHVARLTPLDGDRLIGPTIQAPEFGFDYRGDIQLFDDSGELAADDLLIPWQALVHATRVIDGAFWAVGRPSEPA